MDFDKNKILLRQGSKEVLAFAISEVSFNSNAFNFFDRNVDILGSDNILLYKNLVNANLDRVILLNVMSKISGVLPVEKVQEFNTLYLHKNMLELFEKQDNKISNMYIRVFKYGEGSKTFNYSYTSNFLNNLMRFEIPSTDTQTMVAEKNTNYDDPILGYYHIDIIVDSSPFRLLEGGLEIVRGAKVEV